MQEQPRKRLQLTVIGCLGLLVAGTIALYVLLPRLIPKPPRLTEEEVQGMVTSTLQREARAAFLVTGVLELVVTTRVRNTMRLLPGVLDVPVGTAESTVRVPGYVSYGLPVSAIGADAIRLRGDTVEIRVPEPVVQAVDPQLDRMEVETQAGWLRLTGDAREEVQQRAIAMVRTSLQQHAQRHLSQSEQPRINSAETLHELLHPVFVQAGIERPIFRFQLSETLSYTADRPR